MKIKVHNLLEAKVLCKEWAAYGQHADEDIEFYTHDDQPLAEAKWDCQEQRHELPTTASTQSQSCR
jgi:hypothetical protein